MIVEFKWLTLHHLPIHHPDKQLHTQPGLFNALLSLIPFVIATFVPI